MERTARISVIIPTRNRLEFLRQAVASVVAQSFADWELVVVDDASQDGSGDWLESLDDERIRPLRLAEHRERTVARNAGLRAACGEYVLFLDDDDWLLDGALARLFDALRREPAAVGVVGAYICNSDAGSGSRGIHPRRCHVRNIWPDLLFGWMPLQGLTLFRRSAVVEAGAWNETISLCEDYEFWLRFARLGPVVLIPQPVLAYRVHTAQTSKTGVRKAYKEIRRKAMAGESEEERQRASRSIRARRLTELAHLAYRDAAPGRAAAYVWRAIGCAPWMLGSPIAGPPVLRLALRCSAGAILGRRAILMGRRCKRAMRDSLGTGFLRRGPIGPQEAKYCGKKAGEA
ncbi:MAG TPA: glycosyltransferase [Patescibacteria group bacterium]|nr:glycosyltransferase [Patescibacteria group bacterium]